MTSFRLTPLRGARAGPHASDASRQERDQLAHDVTVRQQVSTRCGSITHCDGTPGCAMPAPRLPFASSTARTRPPYGPQQPRQERRRRAQQADGHDSAPRSRACHSAEFAGVTV